jgi:nucleoid-associated protein YgaU
MLKNWRSKMFSVIAASAISLAVSCASSEEQQGEEVVQGEVQGSDVDHLETPGPSDVSTITALPAEPSASSSGGELDAASLSPVDVLSEAEFGVDASDPKSAESSSDAELSPSAPSSGLAQVDSSEISPVQLPEDVSAPADSGKGVSKMEHERKAKHLQSSSSEASEGQFVYTIKRGDWLARVAKKVYGNASVWREIVKENGLKDGNVIQAGQKLIFKITNDRSRNFSKSYKQVAWKQYYDYPNVGPDGKATIFVKSGDSLSKIAGLVFGDPLQWKNIYSVNKGQILNPNLIFADQKLSFVVDVAYVESPKVEDEAAH